MQKVGCFLCMARQYSLCVKMALGSKRLDTPAIDGRDDRPQIFKKLQGVRHENF